MACQTILPPLRYAFAPVDSCGRFVASKAPDNPKTKVHSGIPIMNKPRLVSGPATAMCPFCRLVTSPATITAPGAMKRKPRRKASITPNCNPFGSALNSAQQPFFFATILWPISCNKKAGPTAKSITGIESNNVRIQVLNPKLEIPPNPLTTMNPNANVNAAVANFRLDFSISLKCQILVSFFIFGLLEKDALA